MKDRFIGSDDEEIYGLLIDSTDDVINDSRRRTNTIQRISKVLYSYTVDGVALATVITSELIPPVIPQPYKEIMKAGVILTNITVTDVLRALTERKHPFNSLTCGTPLKYGLAFMLPMVTSVGLGFSIKLFGGDTIDNVFNSTGTGNSTVPGIGDQLIIMSHPLSHMALLTLLIYSQFGLTKLLIECWKNPVDTNEESGQNLLQIILKTGINAIEPIVMYEALRMILLSVDQNAVLHHHFFPLIVVAMDQTLKFWGYMSRIPKPLDNLVPEESSVGVLTLNDSEIDKFLNSGGQYKSPAPSYSSIAKYAGYYSMRALFAVSAGGLVALEVSNYLRAESDQEKLESRDRLLNLLIMTGATGVAEQVFDLGVKAGGYIWSKLSNCSQTLFGSSRYQPFVETSYEEVYINDSPRKC